MNHYKEMGLEETSILRRIAGVVGHPLSKKSRKDASSPKATSKGSKSSGAAGGKSGTAKKRTGNAAALEMAMSVNTT